MADQRDHNDAARTPGSNPNPSHGPGRARQGGPASVTLRAGASDVERQSSLMDPATQSLADALRWVYNVLMLAIVVLAAVYAASGFQTVNAGEQGIRVRFGAVTDGNLGPGFQPSWPFPIGELIRVSTGAMTISIRDTYWPNVAPELQDATSDQLLQRGGSPRLDPELDGSLLTADGNIAHARWSVTYRRDNPVEFVRNVHPDHERNIISAAVKRGVVHAVASVSIDELLKGVPDPDREPGTFVGVESAVRRIAQDALNDMNSGIVLEQVSMTDRMPPHARTVAQAFARVQAAESQSRSEREAAEEHRRTVLTALAGDSVDVLLSVIDDYEIALETERFEEADRILARLDGMLMGEPVEIDGRRHERIVYGQISRVLEDAREYRSSVVNRTASEAGRFEAMYESFQRNPMVVINHEWVQAFQTFLLRDAVQRQFLPPGVRRLTIELSRDPDITRERERLRHRAELEEAREERRRELQRQRFDTRMERQRPLQQ